MKRVVTCIKHSGSNTYTVLSTDGEPRAEEVKGGLLLSPGEFAEIGGNGEISGGGERATGEQLLGLENEVDAAAGKQIRGMPYRTGMEEIDKATERMWPGIVAAARIMLRKLMLGTPIVVRFHNDADGASGAVGLHRGIGKLLGSFCASPNIIWVMHRGVTYSERDVEADVLACNSYSALGKPLLVIIDFGTSTGSNRGIEVAREKFEIIWLDHHPIEEGFYGESLANYINPWRFGADSGYTAGLFACVFSHSFSDADTSEMESASLVGDYSRFAPGDGRGGEAALILDLITSDPRIISRGGYGITPAEIESAIGDKTRRAELYNYARMRLDETLDAALASMKVIGTKKGEIFILDYGELRSDESKYPLPGRFSSKLLGKLEESRGGPGVVIVHFNQYISMRVSARISEEVDIPGRIKQARELYPDLVESGGGHRNAASIKLSDESGKKEILRYLAESIREGLGGEARQD